MTMDKYITHNGRLPLVYADQSKIVSMGAEKLYAPYSHGSFYGFKVPNSFRFDHYLTVWYPDNAGMPFVCGVIDGLLSSAGYKSLDCEDFLYRVGFRDKDGNEGNPEGVKWCNDKFDELVAANAIHPWTVVA